MPGLLTFPRKLVPNHSTGIDHPAVPGITSGVAGESSACANGVWNMELLSSLSGNLFIILKTNKQIKKGLSETVVFEMDIFQPGGEIH